MARSLEIEDVKRSDLLRIWPEELIVDQEARGRHFKPTLERIMEIGTSIAANGQEQPCAATVTHDKRLKLYAGVTRYEGVMWWNQTHPEDRRRLEVVVKDRTPKEAFLSAIRENRERNLTTVIDDAHNVRRLSELHGMNDEDIRAYYGTPAMGDKPAKPMSESWLEGMRPLVRMPEEEQAKIHSGQLSKSVGLLLAEMPPENRDQLLKDAAVEGNGKVTVASVLKVARKQGKLTKKLELKPSEEKAAWSYLAENDKDKHPKVAKLAALVLEFRSGSLPEPDFYNKLRRLVQ